MIIKDAYCSSSSPHHRFLATFVLYHFPRSKILICALVFRCLLWAWELGRASYPSRFFIANILLNLILVSSRTQIHFCTDCVIDPLHRRFVQAWQCILSLIRQFSPWTFYRPPAYHGPYLLFFIFLNRRALATFVPTLPRWLLFQLRLLQPSSPSFWHLLR